MINDVTYVINTHGDYSLPLRKLLKSMAYIPKDRIRIISGGHNNVRVEQEWHEAFIIPYTTWYVNHDSYDYTGAIAMQDYGIETADHVFFLQDTMEFGMNTDYLIRQADPDIQATAVYGGQCNLALYRADHLLSHSMWDFIQRRRNLSKLESINFEGSMVHRAYTTAAYPGDLQFLGIERPYSDVERMKEYYSGIDLVKWKANWGQNMHALVTRP